MDRFKITNSLLYRLDVSSLYSKSLLRKPNSLSIVIKTGLALTFLTIALVVRTTPSSTPVALADLPNQLAPGSQVKVFTEDFIWEGNHAATIKDGAATTVWWNENNWDTRSDTSNNSATAKGGNDHIDIHRSVPDVTRGILDDAYAVGGDGSPGMGVMDLTFEAIISSRLRNPILISADQPGVIEFSVSNFVTSGHWWEIAIVPAGPDDIVAPAELTAIPAPGTGSIGFAGNPGPGNRPAEDSINFITLGPERPCGQGWDFFNGITKSVNGVTQQIQGPRIDTDPNEQDLLFAWRLEYYPDRIEAFVDFDRNGVLEHHTTIIVDIPWDEVYVELMGIAYQADHHPGCLFQGEKRWFGWKNVKAWPVKYERTASYPKNDIARQVTKETGWTSYDLRDTARFGPADAPVPQPNEARYSRSYGGAICNGSWGRCDRSTVSETLSFELPAHDAVDIARAQLIYDTTKDGSGTLSVNGTAVGQMPGKSTAPGADQIDEWAQRSIDVDPSLFKAGENTITINLSGDVGFDRLHFEFAYDVEFADPTPPSTPANLIASAASDTAINLSWSDASDPDSGILRYNIYRDGVKIGSSGETSFVDTGLEEARSFTYQVSATNSGNVDGSKSDSVVASTLPDTKAPLIDSVSAVAISTQVAINFDEDVSAASATNTANYNINNGIEILSASLHDNLRKVTLTTSEHTAGVLYTLTVNNIWDRAKSPNKIVTNTQITYSFVDVLVDPAIFAASGNEYIAVANGLLPDALVYSDRTYRFTSIPPSVAGATYIRTANDDKIRSEEEFLTFTVSQTVTVYVGNDIRAAGPPNWLSNWTATGDIITTTDTDFDLYSKVFGQGTVTLGGNAAEGATPNIGNYTVAIVVNNSDTPDDPSPSQPASLAISSPGNGSTVIGDTITVAYFVSGDLSEADHAHFTLDGGAEVRDLDFDGAYEFTAVEFGSHVLTGFLARVDHSKIDGTDVSVSFESAAVEQPVAPGVVEWLRVEGNKIVNESGDVVVLRGANVENREWIWNSTKSIDYERNAIPKLTGAAPDGWGANLVLLAVASGPINRNEQDYLDALDELVAIGKANNAYTMLVYRYGEPNSQQPTMPDQTAEDAMALLAQRYANEPAVLYGLQVEPHDVSWSDLAARFTSMINAIQANNPLAVIAVPGTGWSRWINNALTDPILRDNLIYKTHPYDSWQNIESNYKLVEVAAQYPVLIGEFGPGDFMNTQDVISLLDLAEANGMSWTAWLFNEVACPCLLSDANTFATTTYGEEIRRRLQVASGGEDVPPVQSDKSVLVYHETASFVHSSTDDGVTAIHQLGLENGFNVDDTADSSAFTDSNLSQYDAVVFLNTHQDVLTDSEQAAFERYIQAGGGYAGIHIASGTEYGWDWYGGLVGARFNFHPLIQQATVIIEDPTHPSTVALPEQWVREDEWYNFSPRPDRNKVHVLASVLESTYSGGDQGSDHPIAWCQTYDGGRSWYTAMGHLDADYYDNFFLSHVLGGMQYAAGIVEADCSPTPEAPPDPVLNDLISGDPIVSSGRVYQVWEGGIGVGSKVYIDRSFTFTTMPELLDGSSYIMTANDDKSQPTEELLSFILNENAIVYVGYDTRSTSLPDWLSTWTDLNVIVGTTDVSHGLFAKEFAAGAVNLGGNMAQGASGAASNYFVMVVGNGDGGIPPPNDSPIARIEVTPASGDAPLAITANASGSSDADGQVVSYSWSFGDGQTGSGESVNHTYSTAGNYQLGLAVIDDDGATHSTETTISVTEKITISLTITVGNREIDEGQIALIPVMISSVPDGLSGFIVRVTLDNTDAVQFTNITVPEYGVVETVTSPPSLVEIKVADANRIIRIGDTNVVLFTLEIFGVVEGVATLNIEAIKFDDEDGFPFEPETSTGTVTVSSTLPTLPGMEGPVRLDENGLAVDVNGNGRFDFADIVVLFDVLESDEVKQNESLFDFNNNGRVDMADLVSLFQMLVSSD